MKYVTQRQSSIFVHFLSYFSFFCVALLLLSPPRQAVITFMAFYGILKKEIFIRVPFISFIHFFLLCIHPQSFQSLCTLWAIRQYVTPGMVDGIFFFFLLTSFLYVCEQEVPLTTGAEAKKYCEKILSFDMLYFSSDKETIRTTHSLLSGNIVLLCWRSCN